MGFFVTRVELHVADPSDYETLHTAMEKAGFSRTIAFTNGNVYFLPTAEYLYYSETVSHADVHKKAIAAAATVGKLHCEITTPGTPLCAGLILDEEKTRISQSKK